MIILLPIYPTGQEKFLAVDNKDLQCTYPYKAHIQLPCEWATRSNSHEIVVYKNNLR